MQSRLLAETLRLWKDRPRSQTIMVVHMKTEIPFHWLVHFSKGRTKNPQVYYVEALYVFLTGHELSL